VNVTSLHPKLSDDASIANEGLIFHHIVCHTEMQPNYMEESISLGGDQNNASPCSIEGEGPIKVHALVLPSH
jgi:hypothetical protein